MNIPKDGSMWCGTGGTTFLVIKTVILDNKHWIHYSRIDPTGEIKEYSCYLESFLERFTELRVWKD
jgi:hypothetical protein|tara:strand:+ start:368 stop:565 length:198 start_codon:yes stop_codon:yes gene_type:complete